MTADRSSDVLEARLRAALTDLRPTGGAPEALRVRIDALPDEMRANGFLARLRRLVVNPAVVATLATGAAIAVLTLAVPPVVGPATTGGVSPTPAMFDPTVEGPGLVYDVVPTLIIVPGLIAVVAIGFAIWHLLRARWIGGWRGLARLLVLGAVAVPALGLASHSGFLWLGGGWGPVLGYNIRIDPPPGSSDDASVWYETVNPGDPLIVLVTLTNPGPLAIRLEGIVEDPSVPEQSSRRWTGMTIVPDQYAFPWPDDSLPAFEPQTIAPNTQVKVYLAAKAGPCVFGPDFAVDNVDVAGYSSRGREIRFAYSVLGLTSTAPFELPMTLVEPVRNICPTASDN